MLARCQHQRDRPRRQTLALVEGGLRQLRTHREFDTLGTCDFGGTLTGGYTAHPHRDPETGELHAVSYSFAPGQHRAVLGDRCRRAGPPHRRHRGDRRPMMHDFSLTERHVVFYDLPVTFDPVRHGRADGAPRGCGCPPGWCWSRWSAAFASPTRSRCSSTATPRRPTPDARSRGTRIPRPRRGDASRGRRMPTCAGSTSTVLRVPPAECLLRVGTATSPGARRGAQRRDVRPRHRGPNEGRPTLDRWTIDLTNGALHTERRDDRTQEFPRINETLTGRRHRYGYTVGVEGGLIWDDKPGSLRTALYKHDYATGDCATAPLDPDLVTGEMSFVPNPRPREPRTTGF